MERTRELTGNFKCRSAYPVTLAGEDHGFIVTPSGLVSYWHDPAGTILRTACDGREYILRIHPALGPRSLVKEAREFSARATCGELPS